MNLESLKEKLEGKLHVFEVDVIKLYSLNGEDTLDKLVVRHPENKRLEIFGLSQDVLDHIELTEDELIHYIVEWSSACSKATRIMKYFRPMVVGEER